MRRCVCVCVCVFVCVFMCVYTCACVSVWLCVWVSASARARLWIYLRSVFEKCNAKLCSASNPQDNGETKRREGESLRKQSCGIEAIGLEFALHG